MGRPSVCLSDSSLNVKMRVSQEILCLEWRTALVHARGWRKVGRGSADASAAISPWLRLALAASSRVPMW